MAGCCNEITIDLNLLCALLSTAPVQAQDGSITLFGRNGAGACVQTNEVPFAAVAGNGIAITAGGVLGHAPGIDVRLSADAGNQAVFGGDGGVFVPAPVIPPIDCEAVQDCVGPMLVGRGFVYDDANNQWDTTGAAGQFLQSDGTGGAVWAAPPAGGSYNVTGVAGDGCASTGNFGGAVNGPVGPGGTFQFVARNGVDVSWGPPVAGSMNVAIGLRTAGVWGVGPFLAFGCADTNGAPVYCGTGGLRTVPEHSSNQFGRPATQGGPGVIGPGQNVLALVGINIVNPSVCRQATWMTSAEFGYGCASNPDANILGREYATLSGGPLAGPFQAVQFNPTSQGPTTGFTLQLRSSLADTGVVGAGGVVAYQALSEVFHNGGALATGTATVALCGLVVTR